MKNYTLYKFRLYLVLLLMEMFGCMVPIVVAQDLKVTHFKINGRVHIEDCDSVLLQLHTYFLPLSINAFDRIVLPVVEGRFEYEGVEPINGEHPFNLGIYLYVKGQAKGLLGVRNLFLALPSDQVTVDVWKTGVQFAGRGAEKYNVRWALDRFVAKNLFKGTMSEVLGGLDGAEKLAINEAQHDSLYHEKLRYIEAHKSGLTDEEYRILKDDALGTRQHIFLRTVMIVATALGAKDSLLKSHYIERFEKLYSDFEPDTMDSKLKAYAQNFAEYHFDLIHLKHALKRGGGQSFYFGNEQEVYRYIKDHYSGLLRDKMLVMCVQRYRAMDHNNVLLKEASQDVKDVYFNRLVSKSLEQIRVGAKMPTFELADSTGKVSTFAVEKGKVTLIDFWYTGCGACALISGQLHTYLDSMQHVPEFQLVSISIDKDKKVWKKSIESGKYTHPSGLNFYTNGLGTRHPLTMHFDIIGYPRFILVDRNGDIVSSTLYPTTKNIKESVSKALAEH